MAKRDLRSRLDLLFMIIFSLCIWFFAELTYMMWTNDVEMKQMEKQQQTIKELESIRSIYLEQGENQWHQSLR